MRGPAPRDVDVVVVGAGPAGAAAAILLAEQGFETVVVDRARFPRHKICGEYLSPEAGRILDRLGVLKQVDEIAAPLAGMRITAPDGRVLTGTYGTSGRFRPYRPHASAVARVALDAVLVDRLRAMPVDLRQDTRITDLVEADGRVVGVVTRGPDDAPCTIRARLTVGADGRASVVAQRLGLRTRHRLQRMALTAYVRGVAGAGGWGEVFVDPPDYGILNPLRDGRVNLSVVVPLADAAPYSDRLDHFLAARVRQMPRLAERLAGAERVTPVRAMGPLAYAVRPPDHAGVLLVGDAAGFYDPFTGEGVFAALRGAELLVEVAGRELRRGPVTLATRDAYERRRREVFGAKVRVTRALQAVIARRWLANAAGRFLARRPELLGILMGVLGDYIPPRQLLGAILGRGAQ